MSRSIRKVWMVLVATVLMIGVGASAAYAEPAPSASSPSESDLAAADMAPEELASTLPESGGITMPGTSNEIAADVLGLGYEQVVRLNGSRVEIREPVTRGSAVLKAFEAGASSVWPRARDNGRHLFYGGSNMAMKLAGHSASRLAVLGGHIYVSNLKTRDRGDVEDGSVTLKFTPDGVVVNQRHETTEYAVTALDGFVWKGKEYLAIGLNKCGVRVVDPNVPGMRLPGPDPDHRLLFGHWCGRGGVWQRDQITALKMGTDENGRFLLVAGKITSKHPAIAAIDVDANEEIWDKNFRDEDVPSEWPEVISIGTFGPRGKAQIAVGWPTLGVTSFYDLADGKDWRDVRTGVLSVVRFFTEPSGEPRVAFRAGFGHVFTASIAKTDASGEFQVVETTAAHELEWMVPGYRPYSVRIENQTRDELRFQPFTGVSRAEGCWHGAGLRGVKNPFPAEPVPVPAGGQAGPYTTAHKHWGDSCTPLEPGAFYAQVEPAAAPGQGQTLQFHADMKGIQVTEQVGAGRLAVRVEADGPLGVRLVVTERHAAPTIIGAPAVAAARLTPAPVGLPGNGRDDPSRPVHRFTVSGVSWRVPGADADLVEATLPLPVAEGSVDGADWDELGTVASPLAPTREGDRVTMGAAVFDWQYELGATKDYRYFRVSAGGAASQSVDVTGLPAPAPTSELKTLNRLSGTGVSRANGLDQVPMRVSLMGDHGMALDPSDFPDLYQRIYYRDAKTKALITGLGDRTNPDHVLMFSLQPGQYANDGAEADSSGSIGVFFSLRAPQPEREVMAYFKDDGTTRSARDSANGSYVRGVKTPLPADGTGAGGLRIGSCAEGACRLADPAGAPAQHSLTASSVSVQLRTVAVPGSASLPLRQSDETEARPRLQSDVLKVVGARATLSDPNRFGSIATITTHLVTHGERVTLESRYVK